MRDDDYDDAVGVRGWSIGIHLSGIPTYQPPLNGTRYNLRYILTPADALYACSRLRRIRRKPCLTVLPKGLAALSFLHVWKLQRPDAMQSVLSIFCSGLCTRTCISLRNFLRA